jgi:long-chain acyl-CoA synthetase
MPSASVAVRTPNEPQTAPWLEHYPDCVPHSLTYPDHPTWWLLAESARNFADRVAVHYFHERITYAELFANARRFASALVKLGVQPGDRVGLLMPTMPEYLTAIYGAWMAGVVVVSLSPLMVAEEISGLLAATDCRIVIGLDMLGSLVSQASQRPQHWIEVSIAPRLPTWKRFVYTVAKWKRMNFHAMPSDVRHHAFDDFVSQGDANFEPGDSALDSPAFILPTGGTTGKPKAVVLSHRNLVANAWQITHWAGCRVGVESVLAVLPFFHSYGLSTCATGGVAMAATLTLFHRFDPHITLNLIEKHQPSIFYTVPAMLSVLNQHLATGPRNVKSLRYVISGGAPLAGAIAEEFSNHTGAAVVEGYGLSEASPVTHVGPLDHTDRPGTIGLPIPDTFARIVDPDIGDRDLPPGEVGELIVRGPQIMLGYWNNPEETARVLRDGWLFTGDLAVRDADGFFKIVDRKKDLIITSGFNVYPSDVEYVVRQYPGVKDCAVVGCPDPQRGEVVKALLVLDKPSGKRFDRKSFDSFLRKHLSKHKVPRLVEIVTELPKNFLGKVLRWCLREARSPRNLHAEPGDETTDDPTKSNELTEQAIPVGAD